MKNISLILAAAALLVIAFGVVGFLFNTPALTLGLIVAATLGGWAFAAWYCADDQPVMGPDNKDRVTFFMLLQRTFRGVAALTRPIWIRAWLNMPFAAVMGVDAVSMMQPELREAIFGNLWGGLALIVLNLLARYGSTGAHAPIQAPR